MFFKRGKKKQDTVQELKPVYKLSGQNNKIFIIENGTEREITYSEKVAGIEIKIQGNNNRVYLELPIKAVGSTITIDNSNAAVRIGSTFLLNNVRIICNDGNEQRVWIGAGTTMHNVGILATENADIRIGAGCMFSARVYIYGSDGHAMFDVNTGECINGRKHATVIGERCWISSDSIILKNAVIPDNSIVAAASVVTGNFEGESNVCLGGNPAKIIRRNVDWSYESPSERFARMACEEKKLTLSSEELEWSVGQVGRLSAYLNECRIANSQVEWRSEDRSICKVSAAGEVCGTGKGETSIVAAYAGAQAICKVEVR